MTELEVKEIVRNTLKEELEFIKEDIKELKRDTRKTNMDNIARVQQLLYFWGKVVVCWGKNSSEENINIGSRKNGLLLYRCIKFRPRSGSFRRKTSEPALHVQLPALYFTG